MPFLQRVRWLNSMIRVSYVFRGARAPKPFLKVLSVVSSAHSLRLRLIAFALVILAENFLQGLRWRWFLFETERQ
jgi:hypothetical protein